jgi:hypothetical protein
MENRRCAKFILRSTLLPPTTSGGASSASNSVGSRNNNGKTSVTFTNISFRQILGSLYDEYDFFNLQLVGCAQVTGGDTPNDLSSGAITVASSTNGNVITGNYPSDRNFHIKMSGIPFINSLDHSVITQSAIVSAPLTIISVGQTAFSLNNSGGFITTFRKPTPEVVDITIELRRCIDDTNAVYATIGTAGNPFGPSNQFVNADYNMVYIFNIYPIDLEKIDQFDQARERAKLKI